MKTKESIGKKVWRMVLKSATYCLDKATTYTIVDVKDGGECNDWCNHLVLESPTKERVEIREFEGVFIPDYSLPLEQMIQKFLSDNSCYADLAEVSKERIILSISWGDWKHDHGWADTLMRYLGWSCDDEIVTEENGSDCYSSDHYYYKEA